MSPELDEMEKKGPPTDIPAPPYPGPPFEQTAPPYPGPPLDQSTSSCQPPPASYPVTPMVVVQAMPTDAPGQMHCPHCKNTVLTKTEHKVVKPSKMVKCWPCCFIPFCVNSCKDVQHTCPTCNNVLHLYKRM
uniref:LITAF domain-containing protein n=1 Tax=Oryzias melastigma TaxID=30732 RepID=A0A3B3C3B6_ORYME